MTVKELKEVLEACNEDASICIEGKTNITNGICLMDEMVWADPNGRVVRIKIDEITRKRTE